MPVGEMRGVTPTIVKVRTSRGADPSRTGPPAGAASESLSPKARPASPLMDVVSKPVRASLSPISSSPNAVFSRLAGDGANGQALSAESRAERLAWEVRTAAATGLQPCLPHGSLPHGSLRPARRHAPRRLPAHPIICPLRVPPLHSLPSGASLPVGAMTVARPRPTDPGHLVRVRVRVRVRLRLRLRLRFRLRLRLGLGLGSGLGSSHPNPAPEPASAPALAPALTLTLSRARAAARLERTLCTTARVCPPSAQPVVARGGNQRTGRPGRLARYIAHRHGAVQVRSRTEG